MGNKLQPFIVILLASIATRLWNTNNQAELPETLRIIGWLQCMNAKNSGQSCFCCDNGVRLFKHGTTTAIAEISSVRMTNGSAPLNVTSNGKVFEVYSEIEVSMRFPNENYKWVVVRGEPAICIKICDQRGAHL